MRGEMRSHEALAELARAQHGVVSFRQLRELGFSKGHISRAYEAHRLWRIHRGVYAIGHAGLTPEGECMAAVLACAGSAEATVSHRSAAWLWGLIAQRPSQPEVTVLGGRRRRRGIVVHRAELPAPSDRTRLETLPITTVERTLLDLASMASARVLEGAIDRAYRRAELDLGRIDDVLRRRPKAAGRRRLREALDPYRDPAFTRSRAEILFLEAVKRAGLPSPAMNTFVAGFELDAFWEQERFAVEIDGWSSHGGRAAFERDRKRQEEMKLAGIDSIRITARRIEREPEQVTGRLRALLDRRRHELKSI